jgi:hypothetical protein
MTFRHPEYSVVIIYEVYECLCCWSVPMHTSVECNVSKSRSRPISHDDDDDDDDGGKRVPLSDCIGTA